MEVMFYLLFLKKTAQFKTAFRSNRYQKKSNSNEQRLAQNVNASLKM